MKVSYSPNTLGNNTVEPAHNVEIVCANCGFDLDEDEIHADICTDCGTPPELKTECVYTSDNFTACVWRIYVTD
jgi:rRNA maturation endonuclease Nob1